jgi:antitoxin component of MazEF toxin-antitoxin module
MFRIPATDLPAPVDIIDLVDLVTLADLAAEGFGYGSPYVTTPRDAIDALAHQLGDHVTVDDVGRRCVTRETARRMFTERAEAAQRQREARERREAEMGELAAKNRPRGGIPAPDPRRRAACVRDAAGRPRRRTAPPVRAPPSPHTSLAWSQPKAASVNVSLVQWIGAIVFLDGPTASCTASRTSQRVDHD